ncbi:hypothetical protein [Pseudobacteriovorax antillogorgiicola]|uniref:Uncharacterized protein n=1 Tax=Pseudobacteriovorax antillogorgiicola TaxID=1513793 RepID=A0A1Y6B764_9BACT|nr:hypothetical protein [Pseudobacteriovorax antillogorgiicola]TCS58832.1 hypothetical protein EDD56_102347 [Pseudobacteriovorax antillogorgiicola]SME94173.1 hypothetical protein SAMN06296036_10296 [Pseudobacteriovorax antillogorgiicola]
MNPASFFSKVIPSKKYSFLSDLSLKQISHHISQVNAGGALRGSLSGRNFRLSEQISDIGIFRLVFQGCLREENETVAVKAQASFGAKTKSVMMLIVGGISIWMAHTLLLMVRSIINGSPDLKLVTLILAGVFMFQAVKQVSLLGWNACLTQSEGAFLEIF